MRWKDAKVPVEIEVRTRAELDDALAGGATHLLLDNLTPAEAREWIRHINRRATVELSGGITLETVRAYAETGADFISVGRHHAFSAGGGHPLSFGVGIRRCPSIWGGYNPNCPVAASIGAKLSALR